MALARLKRKTETTLADNNCAFNAFALGLCDESLLSQIEKITQHGNKTPDERFRLFIGMTATALSVPDDWVSVKKALLDLRVSDKTRLQVVLARILRTLSVDLAKLPAEEEYHYQKTIEPLLSAFYCYNNPELFGYDNEEIFFKHSFIKRAFRGANEASILKWWKEAGYQKFLEKMNKNGIWAGDLELARLARYFEMVLEIAKVDFSYMVYGNFGRLPSLKGVAGADIDEGQKDKIKQCLYDREIIRRPLHGARNDDADEFVMPGLFRIYIRLDAVPQVELVNAFIEENAQALKNQPVPVTWSPRCIEELLQRNVIIYDQCKKLCFSAMEANRAMIAINAVPCLVAVKEIFRKHYVQHPLMVLSLQKVNGCEHWENTKSLATPKDYLLPRIGHFGAAQRLRSNTLIVLPAKSALRRSDEDVVRRKT